MCLVKPNCGKIHSRRLTTPNFTGARIGTDIMADFLVSAHPYLYDYDTACVLSGFVPPVSSETGLSNLTYRPFLFFDKDSKRTSENLTHWRFAMSNNTIPAPKDTRYITTFQNPALSLLIKRQFARQLGNFMDFVASVTFPIKPDHSIDITEYQFDRIMDIISSELRAMVKDGFSPEHIHEKEIHITGETDMNTLPAVQTEIVVRDIQNMIITLPNRPAAMLDRDLATLYGTDTRSINQAVKRNPNRFPDDFMFQTNRNETKVLISQSVISKESTLKTTPHLFTREGANMLSAVLHTDIAIERSIQIMRAFSAIENEKYQQSRTNSAFNMQELEDRLSTRMETAIESAIDAKFMQFAVLTPTSKTMAKKQLREISKMIDDAIPETTTQTFDRFFEDQCLIVDTENNNLWAKAKDMYAAFKQWCRETVTPPMQKTIFRKILLSRYQEKPSGVDRSRRICGVGLKGNNWGKC